MSLIRCPHCNSEIDENEKICPNCQKALKEEETAIICSNCGEKLLSESVYCPKCGKKIQEENTYINRKQLRIKEILLNKKIWVIAGIAIISLVCVVLFTGRHYECVSDKLYAYGELLEGPSKPSEISLDMNPSFIHNNTKIKLNYFGKEYTAKYYNGYVLWDKKPYLLEGGTEAYTMITKKGNRVNLTITVSYPFEDFTGYIDIELIFER